MLYSSRPLRGKIGQANMIVLDELWWARRIAMSTIPHHKYTLEEYIELDKNSAGRWEYFAGEVVDMAGGSLEHNKIVSNMVRVLGNQLANRGCLVLSSDMCLKVPKALPYRYPDVVVVCD